MERHGRAIEAWLLDVICDDIGQLNIEEYIEFLHLRNELADEALDVKKCMQSKPAILPTELWQCIWSKKVYEEHLDSVQDAARLRFVDLRLELEQSLGPYPGEDLPEVQLNYDQQKLFVGNVMLNFSGDEELYFGVGE